MWIHQTIVGSTEFQIWSSDRTPAVWKKKKWGCETTQGKRFRLLKKKKKKESTVWTMMCWTACRSQPLESPDTQKKHLSSWLSNFVKLPPTWKGKNFCIEKNSCPHTEHKSFSLLKDNLHQWFLSSCTFLVQATAGTSAGALQYSQWCWLGKGVVLNCLPLVCAGKAALFLLCST